MTDGGMEFRTTVQTAEPPFRIEPFERMLFVGSCFAGAIGQRFSDEQFCATVNPYGVMYNPASVLHTVERFCRETAAASAASASAASASAASASAASASAYGVTFPRVVFITLGTNHVYRLRATGEIVDNCQKRPQALFAEEELTVDACADYLAQAVATLRRHRADVNVVFTVSPIRYRKYGYHGSQLSKATLLLAVDRLLHTPHTAQYSPLTYFPAYEIVLDELRDYRFYADDMLHPSSVAVEYIWQQLTEHYLSAAARQWLREWAPLKAALGHRPFNPDSADYQAFMERTRQQIATLRLKYGHSGDALAGC